MHLLERGIGLSRGLRLLPPAGEVLSYLVDPMLMHVAILALDSRVPMHKSSH
jgi:hypothetical protein